MLKWGSRFDPYNEKKKKEKGEKEKQRVGLEEKVNKKIGTRHVSCLACVRPYS